VIDERAQEITLIGQFAGAMEDVGFEDFVGLLAPELFEVQEADAPGRV
jgi:hypothetical protein